MTRKCAIGKAQETRPFPVPARPAFGTPFDPSIHEAVATAAVSDPRDHRVVLEQLQPGCRHGERLLRPAKVVVGLYANRPS